MTRSDGHPAASVWSDILAQALRSDQAVAGTRADGVTLLATRVSDFQARLDAQAAAGEGGYPLLSCILGSAEMIVGPVVTPGSAPCLDCLHRWRWNAWSRKAIGRRRSAEPPLLGAPLRAVVLESLELLACEIAPEVRLFDLQDGTVRRRSLIRHPECPSCRPALRDERLAVNACGRSLSKAQGSMPRQHPLDRYDSVLADLVVDDRLGLVRRIEEAPAPTLLPMTFARLHADGAPTRTEVSVGRSGSAADNRVIAALEAVERVAGMYPCRTHVGVNAPFSALRPDAVDPASFILPAVPASTSADAMPAGDAAEGSLDWVWAWSTREERPKLVPEQVAFYGHSVRKASGARLLWESSNGCAAGASVSEAAVHGLLEVIERDAFLACWYSRKPVPKIVADGIEDPFALSMLHSLDARGLEVTILDLRSGIDVPAIGVALSDRTGATGPFLRYAAGASYDPERALAGALAELASSVREIDDDHRRSKMERGRHLLAHPEEVNTMEDHVDQGWAPESLHIRDFARSPAEAIGWREYAAGARSLRSATAGAMFENLLARVVDACDDVLVVDQTIPELGARGLHCAKVLAPGLLPMTFGARNHRVSERRLRLAHPLAYGFCDPLTIPHLFP
jgi:ribosomal protein S12 methylthiotransferase accessory factor